MRSETLTGCERSFPENEIIVSKTDLAGRMTYVNDIFLDVSGYEESELMGQQHSIIRHPEMPRCIFKLLWDHIKDGKEIFAYVNNRAKNGDNYWVFAHVTCNRDQHNEIVGYHSNRRVARPDALQKIRGLYERLYAEEQRHSDRKEALAASSRMLTETLAATGLDYDEFVLGL
jgi:PAS domain S-box-containing protein